MTRTRRDTSSDRFGFTLLEMLIVISVLAILVTLIVGGGLRIMRQQRVNITKNILLSLDRALEEYIAVAGDIPPFPLVQSELNLLYEDVPGLESDAPAGFEQFADPYGDVPTLSDGYPVRPDASVFVRQSEGLGSVEAILEAIPPRFLVLTLQDGEFPMDPQTLAKDKPSIIDAWGEPDWSLNQPQQGVQQFILYVHPTNRLAQDVYGRCQNGRPYFVSAGPDRFYGHPSELDLIKGFYTSEDQSDDLGLLRKAREDNVYSYDVDWDFVIRTQVFNELR